MKKLIKVELYKIMKSKMLLYILIIIIGYSLCLSFAYKTNDTPINIALSNVYEDYSLFILLFAIYISSKIYTNEIKNNTINNILILPFDKKEIISSKYITSIIIILSTIIITYIIHFIISISILGVIELNNPIYVEQLKSTIPLSTYLNINFIYFYLTIFYISSTAYFLSIILKINVTTIIVVIYLVGEIININVISPTKYLLTSNWDFMYYNFGQIKEGSETNFFFSLFYCTIFILLMYKISINASIRFIKLKNNAIL